MENNQFNMLSAEQIQAEQASFMSKVYGWMAAALVLTGFTAFFVASTPSLIVTILENRLFFYALLFGEIAVVWWLTSRLQSMTAGNATMWFFFYAFINGLTLSVIFIAYTFESIASTFFITAGTFGVMSAYGYFTKKDLSSWGSILFMGLIGVIIAGVVNIFWQNNLFGMVISSIGVLIFVGLTAYDTQKIKALNIIGNEGTDEDRKEAILGALTLYLDFINLFLFLLRLLGGRRN
ncbi:MAG: Bax inhibitor-1/YccA family protein [Spirosomataceae bacterium]